MLHTISMILSVIAIIILAVVFVYLIKRYKYIKEQMYLQNRYEVQEFTDKYDIKHTLTFDNETNHVCSLEKSNGEFFKFKNDEQGRLTDYEDLVKKFIRKFNDKNQIIEFENLKTKKHESYEYDEKGRVSSCIRPNGVQEWYYYNEENDEVWHIRDSEGRNTYNLSCMPKNWEVQNV